jgi:hypothetical protein
MIRPDRFYQNFLDEDCLAETCLICEQERRQKTVRPYRPVLPGYLWIGIEEKR